MTAKKLTGAVRSTAYVVLVISYHSLLTNIYIPRNITSPACD